MENNDPYKDVPEDVKYFYDQFNKNHPNHHGGVEEKVPFNEIKIPKSMPNEYPEGYDPENVKTDDISDKDEKCIQIKNAIGFYNEFKLSINKISNVLIKRRIFIEKQENKDIKVMSKSLREQINNFKVVLEKSKLNTEIDIVGDTIDEFLAELEKIGKDTKLIKDSTEKITLINREMFKKYKNKMNNLKERKKELLKKNN